MKKTAAVYFFMSMICMLIVGCSGPEANFDLNNHNIGASDTEPLDYKDSILVERIYPNDKLILTDISDPGDKVKTRYWDTNGDKKWDAEYQDKSYVELTFVEEGFHKITFCVPLHRNLISQRMPAPIILR